MTTACERKARNEERLQPFLLNPYEIAVCGRRGASLTRIVTRIKQEAPAGFELAWITNHTGNQEWLRDEFGPPRLLGADAVVVEDGTDVKNVPKLVLANADPRVAFSHVIAYLDSGRVSTKSADIPRFSTRKAGRVFSFVWEHFQARAKKTPLYGLILAGGMSTRMKRDKSLLNYYGKPQTLYCLDLLAPVCERVYVSCRADQATQHRRLNVPQIHDRFLGFGPMGGILSALKTHPNAAWLVLGCDLPFVDEATIETLIAGRNPFKYATAFLSARDELPEPLCSIYEPKSVFKLLEHVALGHHCPRKALTNSRVESLTAVNPRALTNVNHPREYEEAVTLLAKTKKAR
ncbi:MAG: NTP transferase domain-containing protein [Candidatus Hydrogenedentes bacterium]|nr:NTP transferase domain-containing protein [Candidatus Hydrogenedentota bacterium]